MKYRIVRSTEEYLAIDIVERLKLYGSKGMLMSLDVHKISNRDLRNFHISGGLVICLCCGYEGILTIDGKDYELGSKSLAVLPENHLISFSEPVTPASMKIIAVTTDYILDMPSPIDTSIFSYSRYIPVMRVSESKYEDFESYFRFIDKELRESSRYQEQIIRSILYALILEISGEYDAQYNLSTGAELKSNNLTDRFFQLLSVYYKENRTVRFYADKLNVTSKHLSTTIRKATGRHVLDWMHEAVLIEAKMLLRTTDMAIYEIADALNFSCSSAFVQFFKKHTGTTPGRA